MRIISGEAKGRVLKTREGKGTRPTDSRSREALFNIIRNRVAEARMVDLYAGSGSIGFEAMSRGAQWCTFVEQNAVACRAIRDNARTLGWSERVQVWQSTVKAALRRMAEAGEAFDIVFADPPFTRPEELRDLANGLEAYCDGLHAANKPMPDLFIIQHHWKAPLQLAPQFRLVQQRRAGESMLSFYEWGDVAGAGAETPEENEEPGASEAG